MYRTTLAAALLALLFTSSPGGYAQDAREAHADETAATIPTLDDFHEVIFTIWHTAWPEKNVAMLAGLAGDVRRLSDTLARTQLPGILRDKEAAWRRIVDELQAVVGEYESASSAPDSVALLDAAERLHARYEALVRLTRPPLREVEEFHQVLYMIYHHYLPGQNREKLVSGVSELKQKMVVLNGAKLPERQKKREAGFIAARKKLSASVAALEVSILDTDPGAFTSAVETMHADYQALERVFE